MMTKPLWDFPPPCRNNFICAIHYNSFIVRHYVLLQHTRTLTSSLLDYTHIRLTAFFTEQPG